MSLHFVWGHLSKNKQWGPSWTSSNPHCCTYSLFLGLKCVIIPSKCSKLTLSLRSLVTSRPNPYWAAFLLCKNRALNFSRSFLGKRRFEHNLNFHLSILHLKLLTYSREGNLEMCFLLRSSNSTFSTTDRFRHFRNY